MPDVQVCVCVYVFRFDYELKSSFSYLSVLQESLPTPPITSCETEHIFSPPCQLASFSNLLTPARGTSLITLTDKRFGNALLFIH